MSDRSDYKAIVRAVRAGRATNPRPAYPHFGEQRSWKFTVGDVDVTLHYGPVARPGVHFDNRCVLNGRKLLRALRGAGVESPFPRVPSFAERLNAEPKR